MTTIHIHPPDGAAAERFTLASDEALVAGRDPDLTAGAAAAGAPTPTRRLVVASPLISSNHVLLWRDQDNLHVRDLESKNGTYLGLEGGVDVSLRGPCEAHLFLAAPRPAARPAAPKPISVADADADAFAHRLKDAVTDWLAQGGARPVVRVVRDEATAADAAAADAAENNDDRFRIPLVDGLTLEIADHDMARTRIRWDSFKAELFPFVYDQLAAFRACRVARVGRPLAYRSPVAERVLREVLDAARARLPLVITGESGTGKTELAAIYGGRNALRPGRRASDSDGPPFVTVHCAHLEPQLAHSLLFGALKGSYTSAHRSIVGAVKLADGGTLFLDDVDALPLDTQAKLLRFLDHGEYEPLGHGEREPLVANVRVVAGTNADLRTAVRERRFREDLYWRLHSGAVVRVPPLRERPEDVEHLLRESPGGSAWAPAAASETPPPGRGASANPSGRRRGSTAPGASVFDCLDADAVTFLLHHHAWRGNFREGIRFCARVAMEPAGRARLDRRRCEQILAETALDDLAFEPRPSSPPPRPEVAPRAGASGTVFERALHEATAWWLAAEGAAPERFDQLHEFCESYLKSAFVAHALGLGAAVARPEAFDRVGRQRLACDLSTVKRKVDDYLALRAQRQAEPSGES